MTHFTPTHLKGTHWAECPCGLEWWVSDIHGDNPLSPPELAKPCHRCRWRLYRRWMALTGAGT